MTFAFDLMHFSRTVFTSIFMHVRSYATCSNHNHLSGLNFVFYVAELFL